MPDTHQPDRLYSEPREQPSSFAFDENVARVFKDMINRSVPGYQTVLGMLGVFAKQYAQPDSMVYDLGCSLGASTLMLRQHIQQPDCKIIAVDNAPAMVSRCRKNLDQAASDIEVEVLCSDIRDIDFQPCSVVSLNFTLQFLPVEDRLTLLTRIYRALKPGGVLVIAEKIAMPSEDEQQWTTQLHHEFKKANGYSELEVAQKRSALENVLIPETAEAHRERLQNAGFETIHQWFHCLNFSAFIALKNSHV